MTLRKYWTEVGFLTSEEYHSALGRWPGCRECGYCDPAEVARGAIDSQGLCGECSAKPVEDDSAERLAEEEDERRWEHNRDLALSDPRPRRDGGSR